MGRREQIADAAIQTLAADGMRGFTHRTIDRRAGLPEGSTSYYYRRRSALLDAAVQRLAELDEQELPRLPVADPDTLVDGIAELLQVWITTGRDRQLARYELMLEATRRPDLLSALRRGREQVVALLAAQLRLAGVAAVGTRARQLAVMIDGILFDQIVDLRSGPPATRDELAELAGAALETVTR